MLRTTEVAAISAGAIGGKVSGAGGGGFMSFITAHDKFMDVRRELAEAGYPPMDVTFEGDGAHGWRVGSDSRVTWSA